MASRKTTRLVAAVLAGLVVSACGTTDKVRAYDNAMQAWREVEIEKVRLKREQFAALNAVAASGGEGAKIAVAFAIFSGMGGVANGRQEQAPLPAPPVDNEERLYRWAALLMPTITNLAVVGFGAKVQMNASDNATRVQEAAWAGMTGLGAAGIAGTRDTALAGFDAFRQLPPSTQTTVTLGNGSVAAIGGGSATLDNSRRCQQSFSLTQPAGAGGAGAYTFTPTGGSVPFSC